jgi:hypothetical protein
VDPPFSGKNASGSVCAHSARSCHESSMFSPDASVIVGPDVGIGEFWAAG